MPERDYMREILDQLRGEQESWVYLRIPEEMTGAEYDLPRGYGHARYRIVGGHGAWHDVQDAQKLYGFVNQEAEWVFEPGQRCFCAAVVRLGGYDGPPDPDKDIRTLLTPYKEEVVNIRSSNPLEKPNS